MCTDVTTGAAARQVTLKDAVSPQSPSETLTCTANDPSASQRRVAELLAAELSGPAALCHWYVSGCGPLSRSVASATSVILEPSVALSGAAETASMFGQALTVP